MQVHHQENLCPREWVRSRLFWRKCLWPAVRGAWGWPTPKSGRPSSVTSIRIGPLKSYSNLLRHVRRVDDPSQSFKSQTQWGAATSEPAKSRREVAATTPPTSSLHTTVKPRRYAHTVGRRVLDAVLQQGCVAPHVQHLQRTVESPTT